MPKYVIAACCLLLLGCQSQPSAEMMELWKQEIIETELAFASLSEKEGIPAAFLAYAAEDAVLLRNNKLIKGKAAIEDRFNQAPPNADSTSLSWAPDFVEVSASGDLAYTYGQYIYTSIDSSGIVRRDTGVFHTVWKRQEDGDWKFVWD